MKLIDVEEELQEAEFKAIDSLSRYKFMQFGYWAAIWVHLKHISDKTHSNPFSPLVNQAKTMREPLVKSGETSSALTGERD